MPGTEPRDGDLKIRCVWTCGLCSAVCREGAIAYAADCVTVDASTCTGCLICVKVCPAGILEDDTLA